jgi:hypothetical protein
MYAMWRDCRNRNLVCRVCPKDSHTTNECGYVDAIIEYEPDAQAVPDPVMQSALSARILQSRADGRQRQQKADERSRQSRRALMSQIARAKKLYSLSEDEESDGDLAQEPPLGSPAAAAAGGPNHGSAAAAPMWPILPNTVLLNPVPLEL